MLDNFETLVSRANTIVGTGVANLLLSVAFIFFLYNVISFLYKRSKGDAKGLEDARNMLGWSIVALFVMVSVWGLVNFLSSNILGSNQKTTIDRPQTNFGGSSVSGEGEQDKQARAFCVSIGSNRARCNSEKDKKCSFNEDDGQCYYKP
jgi:hypothetical protein